MTHQPKTSITLISGQGGLLWGIYALRFFDQISGSPLHVPATSLVKRVNSQTTAAFNYYDVPLPDRNILPLDWILRHIASVPNLYELLIVFFNHQPEVLNLSARDNCGRFSLLVSRRRSHFVILNIIFIQNKSWLNMIHPMGLRRGLRKSITLDKVVYLERSHLFAQIWYGRRFWLNFMAIKRTFICICFLEHRWSFIENRG